MMSDNNAFEKRLCSLLNAYNKDSECNMPDFILARFLLMTLENLQYAISDTSEWNTSDSGSGSDSDKMDGDHQSALASAGFGTDEDYNYGGSNE